MAHVGERSWCPDCQKMQTVVDAYVEDTGDSRVHVEVYWVMDLDCGHQESVQTAVYRSPLQQAGPNPSWSAPDPFREEG